MKLKFVTGGAVAALAAALTFTAVPAAAERPHDGQWQERHERSGDSGQQSRGWQGREQRAAPAQAAPPQAREERNAGQWRGQQQAQAAQQRGQWRQQAQAQPQAVQGQRSWGEGRQDQRTRNWQGQQAQRQQGQSWGERIQRNGTYTDGNRNTTYRDAQRNGSYRDRRDGYRDGNRQGYRDNRQWDRSWRNNNRYDWQRYRQTNRYVYHVSPYYAPYRNYSYRRLNIGFYLDPLFFGQDYWIGDPGYYRLPDVYGPYRWVRYYDDALLVDVYSGQVVDVIYDFFW